MLSKSRHRAMKALFGSALLLALPLTTGCQTGNFGGNIPGYGWVSGWWGAPEAGKNDPTKPPAGYLPSSKADPNGSSYAGGGAVGGGAARGPRGGYGSQADTGGYPKQGSKQGPSYAAGDRSNPSNWGGSANRQASGSSPAGEGEGEYAGTAAKGYGAGRGERSSASYDPYGGNTPSNVEEPEGEPAGRASAYSADARSSAGARNGGYGNRMVSGNQRANKSTDEEGSADVPESYSRGGGNSRYSADETDAPTGRSGRSATISDDDTGAMTADEDVEATYPQTKGYGSSYKVPSNRGAATPSDSRRYPTTKSSSGAGRATDNDYGMSESEETEPAAEEPAVEQVAAVESSRHRLSSKATDILEKGNDDSEFRPGSTGRPGYRKASNVAPAGYSASESESTATRSSSSRYSE